MFILKVNFLPGNLRINVEPGAAQPVVDMVNDFGKIFSGFA